MDGGCYAMSKFEQLLRNEFEELNYFAISTQKHPFNENALPDYWKLNKNFFTGKINTTVKSKHVAQFLIGKSLRAKRFYCTDIRNSILQIIRNKKIDLVVFESVYSAVYLNDILKQGNIKTILRSHNVEHLIWEKYAGRLKGFKKRVMDSETTRLQSFEEHVWKTVDANIFISDKDLEYYHSNIDDGRAVVIPVQMKPERHQPTFNPTRIRLFHIGAMDWTPNLEGVEHFIKDIFPKLVEKFPGIELHIAGKSMPESFKQYESSNLTVHGEVKDSNAFMKANDVLVVPVYSGGGIRIKILEAMSLGKPVISTSVGIDGIPAKLRNEFMLANEVDEWLAAVDYLKDANNYHKIASQAYELIDSRYSEKALKEKLINFIKTQLS